MVLKNRGLFLQTRYTPKEAMLKIFGRTTSFNVQKVLWLADELSLDYEHIELGGKFGGLNTPDFAQLNPMQKVPVLVDGEKSVWESHTILRYLIAEYGNKIWYPDCVFERSQHKGVGLVTNYILTCIYGCILGVLSYASK